MDFQKYFLRNRCRLQIVGTKSISRAGLADLHVKVLPRIAEAQLSMPPLCQSTVSKHSGACLRVKIEGGAGKNGWRSELWHWETLAVASELWSPVRNIVVLETLQSSVYHVLVVTVCTTVQGTQSTSKLV